MNLLESQYIVEKNIWIYNCLIQTGFIRYLWIAWPMQMGAVVRIEVKVVKLIMGAYNP
jgi:hypothetical protein